MYMHWHRWTLALALTREGVPLDKCVTDWIQGKVGARIRGEGPVFLLGFENSDPPFLASKEEGLDMLYQASEL